MHTELLTIERSSAVPKYEQIVRSISEAISKKKLRRGDKLPSLNYVRKKYDVSLNTVVKAYDDLKRQGVIDSTNGKGFHVASESIEHTIRVFLLFDELNLFKQDLYNSFKETLGEKAKIDIFFHHYNFEVYESLILDHLGKYGIYAIMPPPDPTAEKVLERLEPEQVLIIDQQHFISDKYSSIVQDFERETYESLKQGLDRIRKYSKISLINPSSSTHPELAIFTEKIAAGMKQFCQDHSVSYGIENNIDFSKIERNHVYFVVPEDDLVELVKAAKAKNFKVGQDIGIISFNDNKLKEVIEGGITTISTDFKQMGRIAAQSILEHKKIKQINPATLTIRQSL